MVKNVSEGVLGNETQSDLGLMSDAILESETPQYMKPVMTQVSVAQLDYLNKFRLLLEPKKDWDDTTNSKDAEYKTIQLILDMSIEEKYLLLKRLESAAEQIGLAISKDKRACAEKFQKKRASVHHIAFEEQKKANFDAEQKQAFSRLPVVKKKALKNRDKAINALVALGMSKEDAANTVDGAKQ